MDNAERKAPREKSHFYKNSASRKILEAAPLDGSLSNSFDDYTSYWRYHEFYYYKVSSRLLVRDEYVSLYIPSL